MDQPLMPPRVHNNRKLEWSAEPWDRNLGQVPDLGHRHLKQPLTVLQIDHV